MTIIRFSASTKGLHEFIKFTKAHPTLDPVVVIRNKVIIVRYNEKKLTQIVSGPGKL
jgi:hypothetical protein